MGYTQDSFIKIERKELQQAIKEKDTFFFEKVWQYDYFDLYYKKKLKFADIPSQLLLMNNDFYLFWKRGDWGIEYSFIVTDDGFTLELFDNVSRKFYKLIVIKKSYDYFVFFNRGKKDYFIPKECSNCSFEIFEISNP